MSPSWRLLVGAGTVLGLPVTRVTRRLPSLLLFGIRVTESVHKMVLRWQKPWRQLIIEAPLATFAVLKGADAHHRAVNVAILQWSANKKLRIWADNFKFARH
jgi:hypothetical protein